MTGWLLAAACAQPSPDEALRSALEAAVADHATAEAVAERVSPPAQLSTLRPGDRLALQAADIAPDPGLPAPPAGLGEGTAMYWVRPIEAADPRIVGLSWPGPVLFYGVVLPP